jgi:hypothetical protein
VNGDARHLLCCTVARDAQAQKLPRLGGFDLVNAELGGDREVERKLRDDGGFLAHAIADYADRFIKILNVELHVSSITVVSTKHARAPEVRQYRTAARRCLILT